MPTFFCLIMQNNHTVKFLGFCFSFFLHSLSIEVDKESINFKVKILAKLVNTFLDRILRRTFTNVILQLKLNI